MATIARIKLSGSTDGRGVAVAADGTPGTSIHEGPTPPADYDEIWLWASNNNTAAEVVTLQWGGTASTDDHIVTTVQPNETVLIAPGWVLKGNSTELLVKAFSTTASKVNITGHVNRIDDA